ncbi:MAG TPA: hypothetical protein VF510_12020 [Ktedonobacterales bacterium]
MAHDIGRADEADLDERGEDEDFDPKEYDTMVELERLESIEEEMQELGVTTLDDVRRRIADLHRELDED